MRKSPKLYLFVFALLVASLLIAACGGSSGGESASATTPTPEPLPTEVIATVVASYSGPIGRLESAGDTLTTPVNAIGTTQAFAYTGGNPPCPGWVSNVPDYLFQVTTDLNTLVVSFAGSTLGTLMVVGPQGREIFCTDETFSGLNPAREIPQPEQGGYAVFVGRANLSGANQGVLTVTGQ
jgi:hypothetical protein